MKVKDLVVMSKGKRGPKIKFHDEYHKVQRELMRRYRENKKRNEQE